MMLKYVFRKSFIFYITAACLSFVVTFILLSYHQPFNDDAIMMYLKFAKIYIEKGFSAAFEPHIWPFYPLLIAWLSQIAHITIETAVRCIDAIFDAATVVIFLLLVRELGGRRRTQLFALAIILLLPSFNHFRTNIIRDHGYWCFSLLSFWYLIRYVRWGYLSYALGWGVSILLATLFRIEGSLIALIAPIAVWFRYADYGGMKETIRRFFKAYFVMLIAVSVLLIISVIYHEHFSHWIGRLGEIRTQLLEGWQIARSSFLQKVQLIQQAIVLEEGEELGRSFAIGGLVALLIKRLVGGMGLLYVVLFFYGLINIKKFSMDTNALIVWIVFVLCNLIISFLFLFEHFFLVNRYIELLTLLLLLIVPFSLDWLYQQWKNNRTRIGYFSSWVVILILILWIPIVLKSLTYAGYSRVFLEEAGQWAKNNISPSSQIYANDVIFTYYSGRWDKNMTYTIDKSMIQKDILLNSDYAIIHVKKNYKLLQTQILELPLKRLKAFCNQREDCAVIFKVLPKK